MQRTTLARQYLMRAVAMKRSNVKAIQAKVREGLCIIQGCESGCVSRGLCDKHRQRWYQTLRNLSSDEERLQTEEKAIRLGLILPSGEQEQLRGESSNPFAQAIG